MVMLVNEPRIEERPIAERRAAGIDHHDEVRDGVDVASPFANHDHQRLVGKLTAIFPFVIDAVGSGKALPGVNVSDQEVDWTQNCRVPDVAVFLAANPAQDRESHWFGGPERAVEIASLGDRSHEKFPFYAALVFRELLIVDRAPWSLELCRLEPEGFVSIGRSTIEQPSPLDCRTLSLRFRLMPGTPRPQIEITCHDGRQQWLV